MKNGGCPMCHRYFLIFYILREHGLIDLVVTTFLPESPPKEVLEFSNGKRYPLVKVRSGMDAQGHDMTGVECDNVVEIESLLERFDCDAMRSSKESQAQATAEKTFDDLYMVNTVLLLLYCYLHLLIMSPLRRHIFVCFMAKSAFWRGFSALAPYTGVVPI